MQTPGEGRDGARWRDGVPRLVPPPFDHPGSRLLVLGADALDGAIDAVLEHACRSLPAQRVAVLLFDPEDGSVLMNRYWVVPGMPAPHLVRPQLPWITAQLRAGRPVVFTHPAQLPLDSSDERTALEGSGIRSGLLIPLRSADSEPLGWIGFATLDHEQRWTLAQVEAAGRYGELLVPALLRLNAERERDEQLRTHAMLAEVSAAFVGLPPQQVLGQGLDGALRILGRHLGAYRGSAWELEAGGTQTRLLAQWSDGEPALPSQQSMPRGSVGSLLRRHMRTREPWCVSHLGQLPRGSGEMRARLEACGVGAFLMVPLRTGTRDVGWLTFSKPQPSAWPRPMVRRMRVVSELVSAALSRARDAERLRSAEREAHGTRDLMQATLDALVAPVAITDAQGRILAVNAAWRRFGWEDGARSEVGGDLLEACRSAVGERPEAKLILEAVPALLRGELAELRLAYPCATPAGPRWLQLRATRFTLEGAQRLVFAHEDVTELKNAEEQLRDLAGELVQVQDAERRRIASVLHDGAAQQVFAAVLEVRAARRSAPAVSAELAECQEVLEQALLQLRTLSHLLHPPLLDEAGLGVALSAYVQGFSTRSGLAITLEGHEALGRITPESEHALFRMVQEALLNVQRHSGSARARVCVEQGPLEVRVTVYDEGHGFPAAAQPSRPTVGLASMRQRLLQVGGSLEVRSGSGGTEVCARVPRGAPPS